MADKHDQITGVVLAGGEARRMGGQDKGLIMLSGKPMIEHVTSALSMQLNNIVINANRNIERYSLYGFPVIKDAYEGFNGPLAGMASCLKEIETDYMLTVPCDSPFIPSDLVSRMHDSLREENSEIAVADNGERMQPVFSLISRELLPSLERYLADKQRKIDIWFQQHRLSKVDFSDKPRTFINVNTAEDIASIEAEENT